MGMFFPELLPEGFQYAHHSNWSSVHACPRPTFRRAATFAPSEDLQSHLAAPLYLSMTEPQFRESEQNRCVIEFQPLVTELCKLLSDRLRGFCVTSFFTRESANLVACILVCNSVSRCTNRDISGPFFKSGISPIGHHFRRHGTTPCVHIPIQARNAAGPSSPLRVAAMSSLRHPLGPGSADSATCSPRV